MENKNKIVVEVDEFEGLIKCNNKDLLIRMVINREFLDVEEFTDKEDLKVKNLVYSDVLKTIEKYFNLDIIEIQRVGIFSNSELSKELGCEVKDFDFSPDTNSIIIRFDNLEISIDEKGFDIEGSIVYKLDSYQLYELFENLPKACRNVSRKLTEYRLNK